MPDQTWVAGGRPALAAPAREAPRVPLPPRAPLRRAVALLDVAPSRVAQAVLFGFLSLGSAVALAATSAWLIARASQMPPVLTLQVTIVAVRAFGISRGVFRYLERLASHDVALRGTVALREHVYDRLATGRLDVVATVRRGDLLERVGSDADHVGDVVVRALVPIGVSVTVSLGSVAAMLLFLPAAGVWLATGLVLASVVGPWLTARGARRTEADASEARAQAAAAALELVEHAGPLTVAGRARGRLRDLHDADRRWARATARGGRDTAWGAAVGFLGMAVATLGAVLAGVPAVTEGRLSAVGLAVVVLTPLAAFESTTLLPQAAVQLRQSRLAAARLLTLWDAAEPDATSRAPVPGDGPTASDVAPRRWSQTTRQTRPVLASRDLVVGWGGRPACAVPDLAVPDGGSLAITGPSGTGKTTLLATLAGLVTPVAGSVMALGADRAQASVVLTAEDAHVFGTTVLENLRVARGDVEDDEARAALQQAGLGPWLAGLPDGLATMLGSDGVTISGGERRRLLIARAVLSRADVLLFDEPAEHLDPQTADGLVADLLRLPRTTRAGLHPVRAVVVATHHLGALPVADAVVDLTPWREEAGARPALTASGRSGRIR